MSDSPHICTCGDCSPGWEDRCTHEADVERLRRAADALEFERDQRDVEIKRLRDKLNEKMERLRRCAEDRERLRKGIEWVLDAWMTGTTNEVLRERLTIALNPERRHPMTGTEPVEDPERGE